MGDSRSIGSLQTVRGERHFTEAFDKDRTGTCSKVEFKIGLERSVSTYVFCGLAASSIFPPVASLLYCGPCTVLCVFRRVHSFVRHTSVGVIPHAVCFRFGLLRLY